MLNSRFDCGLNICLVSSPHVILVDFTTSTLKDMQGMVRTQVGSSQSYLFIIQKEQN